MTWRIELDKLLNESVFSARVREQSALDRVAGSFADRIVLYGAGNLGRQTAAGLRKHGVQPLAFTDRNSALWGTSIEGVPVLSPEDAVSKFGNSATFVVCVWNPDRVRGIHTLVDYVSSLGARFVVPFVVMFWKYADTFLPYYFWDLPSRLLAQADKIRYAARAFSEESTELFVAHLKVRLFGDSSYFPRPAAESTYFPLDLLTLKPDECFVDCGAFDGDTIRELLQQNNGQFSRIVAFEPDPKTFEALRKDVESRPELNGKTLLYTSVLGARPGKVRFDAVGQMASSVSDNGAIEVECITLDDVLRTEAPTFIKMDIEGSEIPALEGGRRTITQHRPVLAVSIYHRPEDIWRIPLLMRELEPDSSLDLRMYWMDGFDTVCYAIPPERRLIPARMQMLA